VCGLRQPNAVRFLRTMTTHSAGHLFCPNRRTRL
jgi:hypothetical protein